MCGKDKCTMKIVIGTVGTVIALAFVGTTLWAETTPAVRSNNTAPISAELAKTCRELAIKAHPTQVAGSSTASAQAQRDYFKECVTNRGKQN
jgi:hypothetical protein